MKLPLRSSFTHFVATVALLLAGASQATAIVLDIDNFPDPNWSVMPYSPTVANRPYATTVDMHDKKWALIDRTESKTANSAQIIYNGGFKNSSGPIKNDANQIGDIKGSVILGASTWGSGGDFYGVVLRASGAAFDTRNAYFLGLNSTGLVLGWDVGSQFFNVGTLLKSEALSADLLPMTAGANNQYLLEFSFIGKTLDASVFVWDTVNDRKGDLLGSLEYTDEREEALLSGYFGIRGGRYGNVRNGYFREVQFEAIPEPSIAWLLIPAGAILLAKRR